MEKSHSFDWEGKVGRNWANYIGRETLTEKNELKYGKRKETRDCKDIGFVENVLTCLIGTFLPGSTTGDPGKSECL